MIYVDAAGTVVGLAMTAAFWTFTVLYLLTARWEMSAVGRGLFTFSLACSLILTLAFVRSALGDHPVLHVARLVLYTAVLVVVVSFIVLLLRTQAAARRARQASHNLEEQPMGVPRPVPEDGITQEEQAALLRRTDNGPSEPGEEAALHAEFGEPDQRGVYGAPDGDGGEQ